MNHKNDMTAELIAQLVVAGVARPKIARSLDMTYLALDRIMSTPEYHAMENRIAARTKKKMEELADARLEKRLGLKVEVEDAVDEALRVLLAKLNDPDSKEQLRAALEILDRDPLHDFGSRTLAKRLHRSRPRHSRMPSRKLALRTRLLRRHRRSCNDAPMEMASEDSRGKRLHLNRQL